VPPSEDLGLDPSRTGPGKGSRRQRPRKGAKGLAVTRLGDGPGHDRSASPPHLAPAAASGAFAFALPTIRRTIAPKTTLRWWRGKVGVIDESGHRTCSPQPGRKVLQDRGRALSRPVCRASWSSATLAATGTAVGRGDPHRGPRSSVPSQKFVDSRRRWGGGLPRGTVSSADFRSYPPPISWPHWSAGSAPALQACPAGRPPRLALSAHF
jgi:hypothetical protein